MHQFQLSDMKISVLFRFAGLHALIGNNAKMKKKGVDNTPVV
jgi:hypothetical protein